MNDIAIRDMDGEPRVYDLDVAAQLGYARPVNIRNLIKRHHVALEELGPLFTVKRVKNGGEAEEFHLNPPGFVHRHQG